MGQVVDGDGIVLGQAMAMSTLTSEAVTLAIENLYGHLPFFRNHLLTYHLLTYHLLTS